MLVLWNWGGSDPKLILIEMQLTALQTNQYCKLISIPDEIRTELIRLGFCEGDKVLCIANVPGGPVVLQKGLQETAIGNEYCKHIQIEKT